MSVKQGGQVMSINDKNIVLNAKDGSFIDIHKGMAHAIALQGYFTPCTGPANF